MAEPVVVGVVAPPGAAREVARELVEELPEALAAQFPDVEWRAVLAEAEHAAASTDSRELIEMLRQRMLEEGWDLAIGVTDLPLRDGRRPVTAHASATHGVGLVSLPALGGVGRQRRLRTAVIHLIEGLLGESVRRSGNVESAGRSRRMAGRLHELRSPLGRAHAREDGTVRFVGAVLLGNIRLLVGMVRANEPSRVILRLSGALVAALGAAVLSIILSDVWELADAQGWVRLLLLSVFSTVATCVTLIVAHDLWERARTPMARERVILFNLATTATIALGVLTLYVALFAIIAICGAALIPAHVFEQKIGHSVGLEDYLNLAWFVASLATIGGALGSVTESDPAVRHATYRHREDERTEADE